MYHAYVYIQYIYVYVYTCIYHVQYIICPYLSYSTNRSAKWTKEEKKTSSKKGQQRPWLHDRNNDEGISGKIQGLTQKLTCLKVPKLSPNSFLKKDRVLRKLRGWNPTLIVWSIRVLSKILSFDEANIQTNREANIQTNNVAKWCNESGKSGSRLAPHYPGTVEWHPKSWLTGFKWQMKDLYFEYPTKHVKIVVVTGDKPIYRCIWWDFIHFLLEKVGFPAMDHEMMGETFKLRWMATVRRSHDPEESEDTDFVISSTQLELNVSPCRHLFGHVAFEWATWYMSLSYDSLCVFTYLSDLSNHHLGLTASRLPRGAGVSLTSSGSQVSKTNTGSKAFNQNFQQDQARHQLYVGL